MSAPYQLIQVKRIANQTSTFDNYTQTIPEYGELVFSHTNSVDELVVGDGTRALSSLPRLRVHILNLIQANPNLQVNLGSTQAASVFQNNPRPGVTGTLPIANGGTGTTTAAGIREAIGLGSTTGPIPVANGGTGAASVADARANLDAQQTITGAASTITSSNLTTSRALVSDSSGKVAVSSVTATELGYLSGVTSAVQTQLNGKQATLTFDGTYNPSSNKAATVSTVTNAIEALDVTTSGGATSKTITALTQTDGKIAATYSNIAIAASQITSGTLSVARGGTGGSSEKTARAALGVPRITYSTSAPSTDNQAGDLFINSSTRVLQVYTGSAWANIYGVWG